jgi:hypothetical protein
MMVDESTVIWAHEAQHRDMEVQDCAESLEQVSD